MRALVTRPRPEAAEFAAALASRGIDAVIEPLIEIEDRACGVLDLGGVQAVLCTSANGVRALARAGTSRDRPLFAVGDATAARARAEGFVAVESAGGNVADLVRLVRARLAPAAGRLVHVAGKSVAGDLVGELRAAGFGIDRAVLYEARAVAAFTPGTAAALSARVIDFALFFSPRTAAIFARLAAAEGVADALNRVATVSISAAADAALVGLPFRRRHVATAPTQAALLQALDDLLAERVPTL